MYNLRFCFFLLVPDGLNCQFIFYFDILENNDCIALIMCKMNLCRMQSVHL